MMIGCGVSRDDEISTMLPMGSELHPVVPEIGRADEFRSGDCLCGYICSRGRARRSDVGGGRD